MRETIESIAKNAERANPKQDNDYIGNDNLLYCGNCHTPKQCVIKNDCIGELIVNCLCKCKVEEQKRRQAEEKARKLKERAELWQNIAFKNAPKLKGINFDVDDMGNEKLHNFAKKYADDFSPKGSPNLLFFGNCGNGKSFTAACILQEVIKNGFTGLFATVSDISNELWGAEDKQPVMDKIRNVDLLVIDDFGAERSNSDYSAQIRYDIINARYQSGKPTIFTSNLAAEKLFAESFDLQTKRTFSRIMENTQAIKFKGKDRRVQSLRKHNLIEV